MFDSRFGERLDPALATMTAGQRLDELRRRMDAVPGRLGRDHAPAAEVDPRTVVPIPALAALLPHGGLLRGTVVECPRGALTSAIVAAASASGDTVAMVGAHRARLRPGLLDIWEQGGVLDRIALVDVTTAADPISVLAVLTGGVPLITVDLPGMPIRPSEFERLRGRLRTERAILLVSGGDWARQPHLRITAQRTGPCGIGRGTGRLDRQAYHLHVTGPGFTHRGHLTLRPAGDGRTRWDHTTTGTLRTARTG